jgi:hypothetical protein
MNKKIEEMEDSEVEREVSLASIRYSENPSGIVDEQIFSDDELIDLITMIHYLVEAKISSSADSVYSELYKASINEIRRRLGDLPYIT